MISIAIKYVIKAIGYIAGSSFSDITSSSELIGLSWDDVGEEE